MGPLLEFGSQGARARAKLRSRPCLREQNLLHPRIRTKTPRFLQTSRNRSGIFVISQPFLEREASRRAQLVFELLFVVTDLMQLELDMYGYLHNVNL